MIKLSNIAVSSGSACMTGVSEPSHVLKAMNLNNEESRCCIRFSFSKYNTKEQIDIVIQDLKNAIEQIRASSPIWKMYKEGILD